MAPIRRQFNHSRRCQGLIFVSPSKGPINEPLKGGLPFIKSYVCVNGWYGPGTVLMSFQLLTRTVP